MKAAGLSHPGRCRDKNQDSFSIDPENKLFILADGMGGHYGGELASQTAVKGINSYWKEHFSQEESPDYHIREAIYMANEEIFNYHRNMGTTIEIVYIKDSLGWIGHVGDSRIYRLRKNELKLLTKDHTRVKELIDSGQLHPDAARDYPFQHVITKAVGIDEFIFPDVFNVGLKNDDIIIMCSDGLTGDLARSIVTEKEIVKALKEEENLDAVCYNLISAANEKGGPDNITVVIIKIEKE
jgi:PPM family protein phosphatase